MFKLIMIDPIETDKQIQNEIRETHFPATTLEVLDLLDYWADQWDDRISFTCHLTGANAVDFTAEIESAWNARKEKLQSVEDSECEHVPNGSSLGGVYIDYVNTMGWQI